MSQKPKLFLIDASSYFYRAFFALPPLSTASGFPTNALYGFITMLRKLINDHAPEYLAAVLDRPEPTFRHEAYEHYKAHREEMPDDLAAQLPCMKDVLQAFNVAAVEKPGYEADDVIGTLALQAAAEGADVVIVTGDKDMFQLVRPGIFILDTLKNAFYDREAVVRKYDLEPDRLVDMFGLMGDASDNVPGVPGIGPKTAVGLLKQYGSIDNIYLHVEELTRKKLKQSLIENKGQALLSRDLVRIDAGVALDCTWKDFRLDGCDEQQLRQLYKRFEFTSLLRELGPGEQKQANYRLLTDMQDIQNSLAACAGKKRFAVDLETTSERPMEAAIVGIALCCEEGEAYYIPVAHTRLGGQPDRDAVLSLLKPLLEDPAIEKICHNMKYEYVLFARNGIQLRGMACDTMVASYVLNPSKYRHSLDEVALDHLDYRTISYKDVVGSGKKALRFDAVPIEKAVRYACEDADITGRLANLLLPRIDREGFRRLFSGIEMPLVPVLAQMEMHGVRIDTGQLAELSREFAGKLAVIEQEIFSLTGVTFNVNSPKQLGEILFEKLQLPVGKRTKTGYATDVTTLTGLAKVHPLPARVLEYRSLAKLVSTYVDAMPALINPETGRIHTSYNQTVTATGRLSSSDPNLQNIPIRTEEGIRIREAFVPEPGWRMLAADYSQIELRLLAHLSGDRTLIDAFLNNEDIHARTAAELWADGGPVSSGMRRDAKVINFGIIYGMSAYGLSNELGIDQQTAQEYIDAYFARYPDVRRFLDSILEQARREGYVETLMGRRRYLPDINARSGAARKFAERMAINAPIQGAAADMIKIAMIRIHDALVSGGMQSRMIMQVHDELVFEVPGREVKALTELVRREMEGVADLHVPLTVDISTGDNWRQAH